MRRVPAQLCRRVGLGSGQTCGRGREEGDGGMTGDTQDPMEFQSAFEREQAARRKAEELLEEKHQEIIEMNRRLMAEAEAVRSALADTEAVRVREAAALKERLIMSEALKALTGKSGADEAMQALLDVLRKEIGGRDCFFVQAEGDRIVVSVCADRQRQGQFLPLPVSFIERPRRLAKLVNLIDGLPWPGGVQVPASTMIVLLELPDEKPGAILIGCPIADRYTVGEFRTLEQVAKLAAQALLALREARRNKRLLNLIEGKPVETTESVLDAPLEAVHNAFARLTEMQGQVVGILDDLLSAPLKQLDEAIEMALDRMGVLTGTDRAYVFRIQPNGDFIDNTHEWCGVGIEAFKGKRQDTPIGMISTRRAILEAGNDVVFPNVAALPEDAPEREYLIARGVQSVLAVPMFEHGVLRGFIGFDAVREPRNFLPGETYLIRSVAKVIASALARRDAEDKLVAAHAETLSQRKRLEALLSGMPDLIVELDQDARFVTWHSGSIVIPEETADAFVGRTLEEGLAPELGDELREKIRLLDAGVPVVSHTFEVTTLEPLKGWWQLTASSIGEQGYLLAMRNITDERAKAREIERLSEIARRTTNLVLITDAERRIQWVNAAFERITGWTLEDVLGKNPGRVLQNSNTDPNTVSRIRAALDKAQSVQAEILNQTRDGREYWLSLDIQPLHDETGVLTGFLAVEVDITHQREQAESLRLAAAEAALARANLEKAVEGLHDGFVLYDADDRLVICNSRYRQIYAQSESALVVGASFESFVRYGLEVGQYPEAIGREEEWLAERLAKHGESDGEIEQLLPDGTWLRVFDRALPGGGRVGLRVDITELKESEQRARADRSAAMEASLDGIALTDAKGFFVYVNRAHLDMFGYSKNEDLVGKHWSMLYRPEEFDWMEQNAMPIAMRDGGWSGEVMGVAKDGRAFDLDVSLTLNADGGLLCITRDISDRLRERAERERLMNELQLAQRREMIGQMAAGLAHDFNNLLAIISGGASLILEETEKKSAIANGAARVLAASDQAAGLVKRLLTLGARQSELVKLDLRNPVREAAELVRSSLRAPTRLSLKIPDDAVEAMADPTDVLQVLLNLAINARDALEETAGTISIGIDAPDYPENVTEMSIGWLDPSRRYARLTVADNGPGMPPDVASRVLTPYFSTKGDQGTGLGLAVVSSVIEDIGGAMLMTTETGRGTSFDVYWPVDAVEVDQSSAPPQKDTTGRLDGKMVFVVDDQLEVLEVITAYLEAAGAEVAASTDPADIVEVLKEDPDCCDLLVTDYDMPTMSGAQLAEAVKAIAPKLPILLVTALAGEARRSSTLFTNVMAKPIDRESLVKQAELAVFSVVDQKE